MKLTGQAFIGATRVAGQGNALQAMDPADNATLDPVYSSAQSQDVDRACELARQAFGPYRKTDPETRARFLETIADNILELGEGLIQRAMAETGLPRARLEGERGRTVNQLKLFAEVLRADRWLDIQRDPALPERTPPRPDLRSRNIPLGPVAVFGASNFPLAFSVAGGDTASALAAGCPVIVKAHPAHPGTSELVGHALQQAVKQCGLDEGVFSLLFDAGHDVGAALVAHPAIKAVGFTGSRKGGTALMAIAAARPEPIPVYAEMSSINPLFLLSDALEVDPETLAEQYVDSLQMGAGQFCTNPGLLVARTGPALDRFIARATEKLQGSQGQTMLTPGIAQAYNAGLTSLAAQPGVELIARAPDAQAPNQCQSTLLGTRAEHFLKQPELQSEVFGSAALLVQCDSDAQMLAIARGLEGQLTAGLHLTDQVDTTLARELIEVLETRAGRLLINGFPTGVEVCSAMVHGGPYPATSDGRTTSVGTRAIDRFLRPVCYQNFPETLLPVELQGL
ncbi:aldehyde dehydrogenase (NADP(+)) [Marinimicrobium sp. C6131]|uniref:aldehyde dehydrogenase (NADP(+)) n=1 Tax=Marinimicrobium sp. C6131 TaxID=3022676 RepID=UPI00223DE6AC|nr:aldehyde dehydrogenase (NADP(+)) [Marinimicrobium sp. C6131]UZJ42847.1 aldehyde dehydrogenase (NADP(+)) [Marinimicrobium sp. C6131]